MKKAAVIGTGYLGSFHAEKYARSNKAELVAVVDVDEKAAKKCAKKCKAISLSDYHELPGLGVTCVSVASSTQTHYAITKWLLENGIDVLVEKPMTVTTAQAAELIELAKTNSRILQVGHLERFNPAFRAVEAVVTKPRFFEARRIAPFAGRGHDVDVVMDLMIHDIDIISHLVGRPLKRVEAIGMPVLTESVDIANARLTFEGGAVANVSASRAAFKAERTIRIFQPDLYVSLDFGNKKFKICTKGKGIDKFGIPKVDVKETKIAESDALADEINAFLECVETRTTPAVSGEDGLRALQLAEQIRTAFRESMKEISADEEKLIANF